MHRFPVACSAPAGSAAPHSAPFACPRGSGGRPRPLRRPREGGGPSLNGEARTASRCGADACSNAPFAPPRQVERPGDGPPPSRGRRIGRRATSAFARAGDREHAMPCGQTQMCACGRTPIRSLVRPERRSKRGEGLRDVSWDVMFCHVFHAGRSCAAALPGIAPSIPPGFPGFFSGVFRLRFRGMAFLLSAPVSFLSPAGGGTLIRAYPARARARVGAGAVRAPDCPGAPPRASRTQGARLPSASRGSLRACKRPPDDACCALSNCEWL